MLTRVRLASRDAPWTFHDSSRLSSWLEEAPWLHEGGILALRVSGPRHAECLGTWIQAVVCAIDAGASEVQVRALGPATTHHTAAGVVREALDVGLAGRGDERGDLEAIAQVLSIRSFVLVVDASSWTGAEASSAFELLRAIGAGARKLVRGAVLTAVVVHHEPMWAGGDELALDLGGPTSSFSEALSLPEAALWATYVHHRLAWEVGGNLDRALAWNDMLMERAPRMGDDGALESLLNLLSTETWTRLSDAHRSTVQAFLRASPSDPERARLRSELEQHRALWHPGGVMRLVPWMARALLLSEATPLLRAQLRWSLICLPLRRDLLARCLDVEGFARAAHARDLGDPPEEARASWESFRHGEPSSDTRFYPVSSPAVPDGPFAFVELGGFLTALRAGQSRVAALHRLRIVRNYLAHGHYASWACVRELVEAERHILM
jgi:hypothetical protein